MAPQLQEVLQGNNFCFRASQVLLVCQLRGPILLSLPLGLGRHCVCAVCMSLEVHSRNVVCCLLTLQAARARGLSDPRREPQPPPQPPSLTSHLALALAPPPARFLLVANNARLALRTPDRKFSLCPDGSHQRPCGSTSRCSVTAGPVSRFCAFGDQQHLRDRQLSPSGSSWLSFSSMVQAWWRGL